MSNENSATDLFDIYRKTLIQTLTDEHILQASLGCGAKSRRLIDHSTNTQFSDTIDDALAESLVIVRTFLGFESRRRKPLTVQPVSGDYPFDSFLSPCLAPDPAGGTGGRPVFGIAGFSEVEPCPWC
jgi:hypothetical protein